MIVTKSNQKFDKIKLSFDEKFGKFYDQSLENLQHTTTLNHRYVDDLVGCKNSQPFFGLG